MNNVYFNKDVFEKEKVRIINEANSSWKDFLIEEMKKDYMFELFEKLHHEIEIQKQIVYPPRKDWFNILNVSPENLKVVLIGQDPYHGENQAHGFSFSVLPGVKTPPSLKNMYKEIGNQYNIEMDMKNGNLTPWIEQGVMLLNAVLTVRAGAPASHKNFGWQNFTDNLIKYISENYQNKVFFLWGNFAKMKENLINENKHLILHSAHPSPLSAHNGWWDNNHFKLANEYILKNGKKQINWKI